MTWPRMIPIDMLAQKEKVHGATALDKDLQAIVGH